MTDEPDTKASNGSSLNILVDTVMMSIRQLRRLLVFLIGITVVLIGVIMFVTPGPAVVVIPLGLAILAIEFTWARILLHRFRDKAEKLSTDLVDKFKKQETK